MRMAPGSGDICLDLTRLSRAVATMWFLEFQKSESRPCSQLGDMRAPRLQRDATQCQLGIKTSQGPRLFFRPLSRVPVWGSSHLNRLAVVGSIFLQVIFSNLKNFVHPPKKNSHQTRFRTSLRYPLIPNLNPLTTANLLHNSPKTAKSNACTLTFQKEVKEEADCKFRELDGIPTVWPTPQRRRPATKERWKPAAQIRDSKLTSAISCICWNRPELPPWPAIIIICSTFRLSLARH